MPDILVEIFGTIVVIPDAAGTAGVERCGDIRLYNRHKQRIAVPIAIDFLRFDHLAVLTDGGKNRCSVVGVPVIGHLLECSVLFICPAGFRHAMRAKRARGVNAAFKHSDIRNTRIFLCLKCGFACFLSELPFCFFGKTLLLRTLCFALVLGLLFGLQGDDFLPLRFGGALDRRQRKNRESIAYLAADFNTSRSCIDRVFNML